MEARPCQVLEFFNGTKQMLIPLFQRPYEWKNNEWEVLWTDILEQYEIVEDDLVATHFTGAIVTAPAKSTPVGVSKFVVIDGQQRLTTISIILCALRSCMDRNSARYRKITKLIVNEDDEGLDYFKLLPTQRDRPLYQALVEEKPIPDNKFSAAFDYFKKKLTGLDSDGNKIELEKIADVVQGRLTVVAIHLGDGDDPYLIFESLNAKGAPLEQADLIRNYILLRLHSGDQQNAYESAWLPMQDRLPGETLTEFMRQYLMTNGEEVPKSGIYSVLKKRLLKLAENEVLLELKELELSSRSYAFIIGLKDHHNSLVNARLARLRRWEISTSNPFILKLLVRNRCAAVGDDEVASCLDIIESFAVRRTVCAVPTNQLKRVFLSAAKEMPENDIAIWLSKFLANGAVGRRWPRDDEFHEGLFRYRAYSAPQDRCKFLLENIEQSFGHKENVIFVGSTIEHIMPQTLTGIWRDEIGENATAVHERWLDLIGNLTITGYNSELSNSPFETKKSLLAASNFHMNKLIAKSAHWNESDMAARTEFLFDIAKKIWVRPDN